MININKMMEHLSSKVKSVDNDELLVRELLELCSSSTTLNVEKTLVLVEKLKSRHFLAAYKVLHGNTDKNMLNDMVLGEYLKDHILTTEAYEDEEIY